MFYCIVIFILLNACIACSSSCISSNQIADYQVVDYDVTGLDQLVAAGSNAGEWISQSCSGLMIIRLAVAFNNLITVFNRSFIKASTLLSFPILLLNIKCK